MPGMQDLADHTALVAMSAQQTPAPTKSERNLAATLESINAVKHHLSIVTQRFQQVENAPGGRAQLQPAELIEYDSIGALFSDARAAIAQATGSAT